MSSKKKSSAIALLISCRPRQWTKNILVFAAPFFAFNYSKGVWISSLIACICFCLLSASIYIFNDLIDIKNDQAHQTKRFRPIANGDILPRNAFIFSILLAITSIYFSFLLSYKLSLILIIYIIIQISYCTNLKNQPILDLVCISSGFLLRSLAGVISSGLYLSPWFSLTIGLLSLFLAVEKRKAELRNYLVSGVITRKVLKRYSLELLIRFESLLSSSSFITYSLWAAGPSLNGASTALMLLSIPFVLIGIFRYQLLSDPFEFGRRSKDSEELSAESPEEILFKDRGMILIIISWIITVFIIGLIK